VLAGAVGALAEAVLSSSGAAAAAPSGFANFGNAQDTVNALMTACYNVQINGAEQLSIPVDQDLLCGLLRGRFVVGAFDEFAVLESSAGADQRDQVRRVHGTPA
jgi:hypothetical protein